LRYLGLALFAEGPTDHAFLAPLLQRLSAQLCCQHGRYAVEVGEEVYALSTPPGRGHASREDRIFEAAWAARGAWTILFIHADAGNDAGAARCERIDPAAHRLLDALEGPPGRAVAVVPVRETEAWTLVDGEALRRVLGTRRSDQELGLPGRPGDVERLLDPKRCLRAIREASRGAQRGVLGMIGLHISLERLEQVPAFRALRDELLGALQELEYV